MHLQYPLPQNCYRLCDLNVLLQQEKASFEKKIQNLNIINKQQQDAFNDLKVKVQRVFLSAREHSSVLKSSDVLKKQLDTIEDEQKRLKLVFGQLVINDRAEEKNKPKSIEHVTPSKKLTSSVVKRKRSTKFSDDTMESAKCIEPSKGSHDLAASVAERKRNPKVLNEVKDGEMGQTKRVAQSKVAKNRTSNVVKRKNSSKIDQAKGGLAKSAKQNKEKTYFGVEQILDHKMKFFYRQFFIKWENFDNTYNSWAYEDSLKCDDILKQYLKSKNLQ